jgi:hypothetical protein
MGVDKEELQNQIPTLMESYSLNQIFLLLMRSFVAQFLWISSNRIISEYNGLVTAIGNSLKTEIDKCIRGLTLPTE